MSERAPYSRVYWDIVDDPKFGTIFDNNDHLATWLRLLMQADAQWPASSAVPATARKASVKALSDAGLIDLVPGGRFRVHGLDAERGRRREAARTGTKREPDGGPTGTGRPWTTGPKPSLAEPRQDEPSNGRADAMDTYWTLLGTYPNGRTKEWLQELVNEFDDVRVSAALAVEVNGPRQGVLSRVRDRLRSDADKAARAKATAETERLEAEAAARRITPEQAEENRRRVAEELRKMGVKG